MSNPSDWIHINFNDVNQAEIPPPAAATRTTATAAQPRVDRPIRRRSRASRRTPTTLLNTDTTNFRAMVQHFTGVPTTTASASAAVGMFDFAQHAAGATAPVSRGGFQVQYPNQMQQRRMYVVGGGGAASHGHGPPEPSPMEEHRSYDGYMRFDP